MNYIAMDSSADIIEHYGIRGMRWGVRSRHAGVADAYSQYKLARKKNRRDRSGDRFGDRDYAFDKAARSLSRKQMAKHKYKAARAAALLKERPGAKHLKDKIKEHTKQASEYEKVFKKYQEHIHNSKSHNGHNYKHVDKSNLSGKEKEINKSLNRSGKLRNAADAAAATAVMGGLVASPYLIDRYMTKR